MPFASVNRYVAGIALVFSLLPGAAQAQQDPLELFDWLDDSPYAKRVQQSDRQVEAHMISLGRIKKVRGDWSPDKLERVNGRLVSSTWQIMEGASSAAMFDEVVAPVDERADARLLFSCSARGCGASVQWANLVFSQRILYGTEASQHYRVYALGDEGADRYRVLVYASARTSDRQYLHTEILVLDP